jgi:hypothetical protein
VKFCTTHAAAIYIRLLRFSNIALLEEKGQALMDSEKPTKLNPPAHQ